MKLEFADGSSIDVISIYGNPRLILGVMRDTLTIEISQSNHTYQEIKDIFSNPIKTSLMYTHGPDSNPFSEETEDVRTQIGEGYKIFVSLSDEIREIPKVPGSISPMKVEEIFAVTLSQLTYQESKLEELTGDSQVYKMAGDSDT